MHDGTTCMHACMLCKLHPSLSDSFIKEVQMLREKEKLTLDVTEDLFTIKQMKDDLHLSEYL